MSKNKIITGIIIILMSLGLTACAEASAATNSNDSIKANVIDVKSDSVQVPEWKSVDGYNSYTEWLKDFAKSKEELKNIRAAMDENENVEWATGEQLDEIADLEEKAKTASTVKELKEYSERYNQILQDIADQRAESEASYYESYTYTSYSGYSGGYTVTDAHDLLNGQGRAVDSDGTTYTYYNHDIGNGPLDIPGENFDSDGVSHDGDGYIVVAADGYNYGDVIDTPYGEAKVYDKGSGYGNIDLYTNR